MVALEGIKIKILLINVLDCHIDDQTFAAVIILNTNPDKAVLPDSMRNR